MVANSTQEKNSLLDTTSQVYTSKREYRFWKGVTKLGQLPWMLFVVAIFALYLFALRGGFNEYLPWNSLMQSDVGMYVDQTIESFVATISPASAVSPARWIMMTFRLLFALGLSYLIGSVIKAFFFKQRPVSQAYKNRWQKIDASSFPSIHTTNSFLIAFFAIYGSISYDTISQIHIVIAIFMRFLFYSLVSLSRIVLKKHYPIDLIGGIIFGIFILFLMSIFQAQIDTLIAFFAKPILGLLLEIIL